MGERKRLDRDAPNSFHVLPTLVVALSHPAPFSRSFGYIPTLSFRFLAPIMPAPKAKAAPAVAAAKKPNGKENGSAAPAPAVTKSNGDVAKEDAAPTVGGSSRPDKAAYDAEQARIKSEIDALQVKVVRTSLLPHVMSHNIT